MLEGLAQVKQARSKVLSLQGVLLPGIFPRLLLLVKVMRMWTLRVTRYLYSGHQFQHNIAHGMACSSTQHTVCAYLDCAMCAGEDYVGVEMQSHAWAVCKIAQVMMSSLCQRVSNMCRPAVDSLKT